MASNTLLVLRSNILTNQLLPADVPRVKTFLKRVSFFLMKTSKFDLTKTEFEDIIQSLFGICCTSVEYPKKPPLLLRKE